MKRSQVLLITGSSGYLSQLVIEKVLAAGLFDKVVGLDVKPPVGWWPVPKDKFVFQRGDVRDSGHLQSIFLEYQPTVVLHLAWVFNPVTDHAFQRAVDVDGSQNIFELSARMGHTLGIPVRKIVYMSSTTAYVNPNNQWKPPFIKEEDAVSGTPRYLYSKHKAEVDRYVQGFTKRNTQMTVTALRGSIIIGPHTKNIVSQVADWHLPGMGRYMFAVRGFNPPMQFLSEEDFVEILFKTIAEDHPGIFNVAGDGVIPYHDMIAMLGKKPLALPPAMIYPATELLWRYKLCPFPAGILDLIRYPWVADNFKMKQILGFGPKKTSREAFAEFADSRK